MDWVKGADACGEFIDGIKDTDTDLNIHTGTRGGCGGRPYHAVSRSVSTGPSTRELKVLGGLSR